uniref:Uncharacterized protein n=1 Tax=Caenorhabditis japonica TaxID=281687 RepID=A0A8R1IIV6_CAEJA
MSSHRDQEDGSEKKKNQQLLIAAHIGVVKNRW